MNLKELALQNRKSCTVARTRRENYATFDKTMDESCNSQCNHYATDSLQPLQNIDSVCNSLCNSYATGQNLTVQLLPQKTTQKLHTKNTELHTKSEEKSPVFGGGDYVILANSANQQAANDPVKNESYSPLEDGQLNRKSEDKQSPENLGDALKTEQTTAPNFWDRFAPMAESSAVEQQPPFSLNNYSHCVTCNQCEHLSLTGSCSRLGKRVIATALRECGSFQLLISERKPLIEVKPYTQDELNRLLNQAAKPLYHHLIDCEQCSLEDARYCVEGFGLGNTFDCLLLCFDDAANKRYELMNQVIKARLSRRMQFVGLNSDNAPLPRQDAVKAHQWGNTREYEAFINHWTACQVCKPSLGRYCAEGQRLEKEANR